MGKGIIKEILKNDEGEYVGEYRVELQKDTSRAKFMVEALKFQITAINERITVLESEITELEHDRDKLKRDIDRLLWLADCVKHGFSDQRMVIITDPANPTTPPLSNWKDMKVKETANNIISKPKKPGEILPNHKDNWNIITQNNHKPDDRIIAIITGDPIIIDNILDPGTREVVLPDPTTDHLIIDPVTGQITYNANDIGQITPETLDQSGTIYVDGIDVGQINVDPITGEIDINPDGTIVIDPDIGKIIIDQINHEMKWDIDSESILQTEDLIVDPITGAVTRHITGKTIITDQEIIDAIIPINRTFDSDVILITTKESGDEYPTAIVAVDINNPEEPTISNNPLDALPGVISASSVHIPITNTDVAVVMMVDGTAIIVDCTDPNNLLSTPLPLPGNACAVGLDKDGNVILMAYDPDTGEATLYDLDPADLGNPNRRGSATVPGSPAYFEQILISYHNGDDPGEYAHFIASTYYGNDQADTGMVTMNIEDKDNPYYVSRFNEFANNYSYYFHIFESEYSEDILYIVEGFDEPIAAVKTFQDQNRKFVDYARTKVRRWRVLIVSIADPANPTTVGVIESSNTGDPNAVKQKPTSPPPNCMTENDDVLVIVGQTTEP